jgi:transposase
MHVEHYHSPERLAELIRAETCARRARRLSAVRLAMLGQTAAEAGAAVLLSERQVRTWVARYNGGGLPALDDLPGRGRKGPLDDPDQRRRLRRRLKGGPTPQDGVCAFRGEDVRRILEEEFGVVRGLDAVYDLMHELGFEPLRPRPRHPDADPDEQEAFKKSSPR